MAEQFKSIPEYFISNLTQRSDDLVWSQVDGSSQTKSEFYKQAQSIAAKLVENGLRLNDRVAIISNTRPEYLVIDFAIQLAGGTTVALYQTLTSAELGYQLFDSEVKIVFVENEEQAKKIEELTNNEINFPKVEKREASKVRISFSAVFSIEKVDGLLSFNEFPEKEFEFEEACDLSTIIYTSGTTGMPKGVLQTQQNHLANIRQVWEAQFLNGVKTIFLFLPLAHSFARLMANLCILGDIQLVLPRVASREHSKIDPNMLTDDIRKANANVYPVVPRLLEKIQSGIEHKTKYGFKGKLIKLAIKAGKRISADREWGKKTGLVDQIIYHGLEPIRQAISTQVFGNNFMFCVSGGAKLNPETYDFFNALGICILEGYGLTETCVATNVNLPGKQKRTSVGKVLAPDIEVKILEDGEICFRGPNISPGYLNRPEATSASFDEDNFFHTGDLGRLDSNNYLYVTGRKKELIITSYGKKIAPIEIEDKIRNSNLISQVIIVGEGRQYLSALITINPVFSTGNDQKEVAKIIESVNSTVAGYEQVKRFKILDQDFTIENGFLTPTFKVKRDLVIKNYKELIDEMY